MRKIFLFIPAAGCVFTAYTQNNTSITDSVVNDSVNHSVIETDKSSNTKSLNYKSLVLPSAFVLYGSLALESNGLKNFNKEVKEKIFAEDRLHSGRIDNCLQFVPAVAVYALNITGIKGKNNFRDRTIIYALSELITRSTVFCIKKVTGETRPDGSDKLSFPSGHTATAFCSAEFLHQEYGGISPWYSITGYLIAGTTGYLRLSNNKHWLSDVVAGAGIGIISTKLVYWVYPAIKRRLFKTKEVHTFVMPSYNNRAWGLSLVRSF